MPDLTMGPDGFSYASGTQSNIGIPFYRRATSTSSSSLGSSYSDFFTTPDWNIPKNSQFTIHFRCPCRSETTGWGGLYIRPYYRVNSGSWVQCCNSGFTTSMGTGKRMIGGHDHVQTFDFTNMTSDFTFAIKFQGRRYDSTNAVMGGSHNFAGADAARTPITGSDNPWWHYCVLNGWSRA